MNIEAYGASDDLIEIEGDTREEFDWYQQNEKPCYLQFNDGTVLKLFYSKDGEWKVSVETKGACDVKIDPSDGPDSENYSDRAILTGGPEFEWVNFRKTTPKRLPA